MKVLFFLLVTLGFSANASDLKTRCENLTSPVPWSYCVNETEGSRNPDVVYVFHGGGGRVGRWAESSPVREVWEREGFAAPTVVEISFGPFFLLVPDTGSPISGLFDVFLKEVLPYVEETVLKRTVSSRKLLGYSMGGLNSAMLVKLAPHLFTAAALMSPAPLLGISPFANEEELQAYAEKGGTPLASIKNIAEQAKVFFPTQQAWDNYSPLSENPPFLKPDGPRVYISAGEKDAPYYFGAKLLAQSAQKSGGRVIWDSISGGDHGTINYEAVARFLIE